MLEATVHVKITCDVCGDTTIHGEFRGSAILGAIKALGELPVDGWTIVEEKTGRVVCGKCRPRPGKARQPNA